MKLQDIMAAIVSERSRQEYLKRSGEHKYSCADHNMSDASKQCVLSEECGEVARVINDATVEMPEDEYHRQLKAELVQCAAVCVAWLECIP